MTVSELSFYIGGVGYWESLGKMPGLKEDATPEEKTAYTQGARAATRCMKNLCYDIDEIELRMAELKVMNFYRQCLRDLEQRQIPPRAQLFEGNRYTHNG